MALQMARAVAFALVLLAPPAATAGELVRLDKDWDGKSHCGFCRQHSVPARSDNGKRAEDHSGTTITTAALEIEWAEN